MLSAGPFRAARASKRFLRILQVPHECPRHVMRSSCFFAVLKLWGKHRDVRGFLEISPTPASSPVLLSAPKSARWSFFAPPQLFDFRDFEGMFTHAMAWPQSITLKARSCRSHPQPGRVGAAVRSGAEYAKRAGRDRLGAAPVDR
jgi:hypothetical protein